MLLPGPGEIRNEEHVMVLLLAEWEGAATKLSRLLLR